MSLWSAYEAVERRLIQGLLIPKRYLEARRQRKNAEHAAWVADVRKRAQDMGRRLAEDRLRRERAELDRYAERVSKVVDARLTAIEQALDDAEARMDALEKDKDPS